MNLFIFISATATKKLLNLNLEICISCAVVKQMNQENTNEFNIKNATKILSKQY